MCKASVRFVSCLLLLSLAGAALGDLVAHWKFNEGSGSTVRDSSGNDHHGTILGTPTWGAGPKGLGGALDFDPGCVGVDCGVFDPTNGQGKFTIAFWAFWDGTGTYQHFLTKSNGWGATTMMFQIELWGAHTEAAYTDRVGISYEPAGSVEFSVMPKNQWAHLAFVFDGTNLRLFLNGVDERGPRPFSVGPNINAPVLLGVDYNAGRVFHGLLDDFRIYDQALTEAQIKQIMKSQAALAVDESPPNGATDVPCDTSMSWGPGEYAATHDVYLGTVFNDVNSASRANPAGVLASQDQAATAFDPEGLLEYGQTYFWRVDEVNAAPDSTVFKGQTWSFTTESYGYPIANITATASSAQPGMGPENTINGSGLDADDGHSTQLTQMWMTGGAAPNWIQYQFDKVYKLHELWVWNSNQLIESFIGFGARDVTVEYSRDGQTWTVLEGAPEFAKATGAPSYKANTVVAFGGIEAQFVKLTINKAWGVAPQTGLSEVRFFHIPVQAFGPQPATAATEVSIDTVLSWRSGREAQSHEVYVGTDENALALVDTVTEHSAVPGALDLGTTYFWKVNEIGGAGPYEGEVWSFTTQEFAAIDDFEVYNDEDNRIYDSWIDGLTTGASGSQVGYDVSPFAEKTIVHGGKQAMPLIYDNSASPFYSEAERTFDSPQNWTVSGADTLSLWMQDAPAGVYLIVQDSAGKTATATHAAATPAGQWAQWTIPFSDLAGVNMSRVKKLTIGVGSKAAPTPGGAGTLFLDDIGYGHPVP